MNKSMGMVWLKDTLNAYFNFDFLYASIIALLILGIICLCKRKSLTRKCIFYVGVLAIYIALLIGGTLLRRKSGTGSGMELLLFWSYRQYLAEKYLPLLLQIIYNVLVFIPWPILIAKVFPKMRKFIWSIGSAFLFSVFIEMTQLVLKIGLFEFDDMFHNTLGAVIGYGILTLYSRQKQKGVKE